MARSRRCWGERRFRLQVIRADLPSRTRQAEHPRVPLPASQGRHLQPAHQFQGRTGTLQASDHGEPGSTTQPPGRDRQKTQAGKEFPTRSNRFAPAQSGRCSRWKCCHRQSVSGRCRRPIATTIGRNVDALPAVHICPVGHTAPAQASTQLPLTQARPAEQVIFHIPNRRTCQSTTSRPDRCCMAGSRTS